MNTPTTSAPLVPSDVRGDKILIRAVTASVIAATRFAARPQQIAEQFWPRDSGTHAFLERAAISGGTTTASGWAADLAAKSVSAFIGTLQQSAAAKLIAASMRVASPANAFTTISLPRASSNTTPLWVSESGVAPVGQAVIAGPVLGPPCKLLLIEVVTKELAQYCGAGDLETIIGTILRDAVTRSLDLAIFSATASSSSQPAGILNGVTGTTATTAATGAFGCLSDMRLLLDTTVAAGGSGDVAWVCSPGRALAARTYAPDVADRVFASAAIAAGVLICVDVNSFTSMFGADPELDVSEEAVLHMESTTPLNIGTAGSPPTVAAPVQSMFQTAQIAIRMLLPAAWTMRVPGAVAFISTGMSW